MNRSMNPFGKRDSLNITYFNSQFHRLIAKASNNEYLSTYIQKIRVEEQRLAFLCFSKEVSVTYALKEHFRASDPATFEYDHLPRKTGCPETR